MIGRKEEEDGITNGKYKTERSSKYERDIHNSSLSGIRLKGRSRRRSLAQFPEKKRKKRLLRPSYPVRMIDEASSHYDQQQLREDLLEELVTPYPPHLLQTVIRRLGAEGTSEIAISRTKKMDLRGTRKEKGIDRERRNGTDGWTCSILHG